MAEIGCLVAAVGSIKLKTGLHLICKRVMSSLLVPPADVRGMKDLDRSKFTTTTEVPVLILGKVNMANVMPCIKKYILKIPKFKPVKDDNEIDDIDCQRYTKIAFLDPDKVQRFEDIDESDRNILSTYNATEIVRREIKLDYVNWRYDEIFKAVFPEGIEVPNAYSKIGHIVHLNLRESQLDFKKLIGEVLLDKVSHSRTVVNKLNTIDTTYRHFSMEVIAGDNDTMATVTENGCKYKFDFATVYWNPRLSTEHQRLVSFLKKGDVLYDVFAGVGPFSIPAAVKGCKVMANDLNPESYKWLKENSKINKMRGDFEPFNKDGRDFLKLIVREDILERRKNGASGTEHIAMNLPAIAAEFLDAFTEMFSQEDSEKVSETPPTVHLYCFVKLGRDEDPYRAAQILVEDKLGRDIRSDSLVTIHHVRNVSPSKEMMRVSFLLTKDLLTSDGEQPANKKLKIEYPLNVSSSSTSSFVDDNVVGKDGKEQATAQDQKCVQGSRSS